MTPRPLKFRTNGATKVLYLITEERGETGLENHSLRSKGH